MFIGRSRGGAQGICLPPPLWEEIMRHTGTKFFIDPHLNLILSTLQAEVPSIFPTFLGR